MNNPDPQFWIDMAVVIALVAVLVWVVLNVCQL